MTITISRQAYWELFQETVERSQHPDPDDGMDVVYKYPQPLGQGYLRLIELREGLVLSILNLQLSDRIIEQLPEHSFNLWTSYEIQAGNLKGFGFGVGLFFLGNRQGDLANTFELPSYFLTNAALFYKQDRLRVALNFKNLFDVDYYESSTSRLNVFPGEPFTVQGTISWEF